MSKFNEMPNFSGVTKGSTEYNTVIKERNAIKKEAKALIIATILENKESFEAEVVEAAQCLVAKSTGGNAGNSIANKVADLFEKIGDKVDEDQIFTELKLGRLEMKNYTRDIIKKSDVDTRKFIGFDPVEGVYTLQGIGSIPTDWTGYKPVSVEDVEADVEDISVDEEA